MFFLNWWIARVQKFSNFNHSCPVTSFIVKTDKVDIDEFFSFDVALVPSGRYRVDISLTEDDRIPFVEMKIFGTNSEHHLDKV